MGVAGKGTAAQMLEFVQRHDLGHVQHVADVDGAVWAVNDVPGQPAWIFVDGETGAARKVFGGLGVDGLTDAIEQLKA